ncbi:MAG: hypothetical protein NVSMB27_49020 [Ktedonobacteraceae bacterium]
MQKNSTRTGNPAFRQGLLFGILLGLLSIVFNVILSLAGLSTLFIGAIMTTFTGSGYLISIVGLIVAILVYLVAGMRAAQQTGRVGTGALAGLWTGLIGAVITWVYALVFYANPPTIVAPQLSSIVLSAILSIALTLLFGAGVGALGGLLRKR